MALRRVKRIYPMQIALMRLLDHAWFARSRRAAALTAAMAWALAKKPSSRY